SPSKYETQLRFLLPRIEGLCRLRSRHPTLTVTVRLPHEGESDTLAPSPAGCVHEIVLAATYHRRCHRLSKEVSSKQFMRKYVATGRCNICNQCTDDAQHHVPSFPEGESDTLAPSPAGCMHEIVLAATHHR
ncbi:hypothetical protein DQ04_23311000, partial [Trypanosoma grayi]|uniref:hypothetical protein n=1 Tax=Trypanosoma grayi TaxID=71804 RepID=UPI0004F462F4